MVLSTAKCLVKASEVFVEILSKRCTKRDGAARRSCRQQRQQRGHVFRNGVDRTNRRIVGEGGMCNRIVDGRSRIGNREITLHVVYSRNNSVGGIIDAVDNC